MKRWWRRLWLVLVLLGAVSAWAQDSLPRTDPNAANGIDHWLTRLHQAARQRAYVGTFVVSAGDAMSSARIWHVCDGRQQMERIDALTGVPRSTFRRNDEVVTFLPVTRVAIRERRESWGNFPDLLAQADSSIARFYRLKAVGQGRVAGLEADVVQLEPVDAWRFGYRIWVDKKTGMLVKLQTLDASQTILEQSAFSELQMVQPLSMKELAAQMDNMAGYQVRQTGLTATVAEKEGWSLKAPVPGFRPMSCHKRAEPELQAAGAGTLQWVFSDGLASVSLFIEVFDATRHDEAAQRERLTMGATHVLTRHLGSWWVTAVGEVPESTLAAMVQGLVRKP